MIILRIELHSLTVMLSALLLLVLVLIVAVIIYGYRNFLLINNAQHWKRMIEDKLSYAIFNGIDATPCWLVGAVMLKPKKNSCGN